MDRREVVRFEAYAPSLGRWFAGTVYPYAEGISVYFRDVTERKYLEQDLRRSETRYQELFRKIPLPTYTWQRQGADFVLVSYNDAAAHITDGQIATLVGSRLQDLYADSPEVLQDFRMCIENHTTVRREMAYTLKSSGLPKHLWAHYTFVPPDTIMVHTEDISERKHAELELRKSEERYRGLIESQYDLVVRVDPQNRYTFVNNAFCKKFAKQREELIGSSFVPLIHEDDRDRTLDALQQLTLPPYRVIVEQRVLTPEGWRWMTWEDYAIRDEQGKLIEIQAVGRDITEQKKIETQIHDSLQEKEMLLHEIHHRVKNNLQIISSLLYFQAKQAHDPASAQVFLEGQNRLRAMILVHEQLYRAESLSRIDFAPYVRSLVQQLAQSYSQLRQKIQISVDSDDIHLPIEIALPCGMMLNELLTNIFKYAYPHGQSGTAAVLVTRRDTGIQIHVADDGVGIPASVNVATPTSFGMQLINNLAAQVKGTVQYAQDHGTKVTVTINLPERAAHA